MEWSGAVVCVSRSFGRWQRGNLVPFGWLFKCVAQVSCLHLTRSILQDTVLEPLTICIISRTVYYDFSVHSTDSSVTGVAGSFSSSSTGPDRSIPIRRTTNQAGIMAKPQRPKLSDDEPRSANDFTELLPYPTACDWLSVMSLTCTHS